jgi:hypothetical protein
MMAGTARGPTPGTPRARTPVGRQTGAPRARQAAAAERCLWFRGDLARAAEENDGFPGK